MALRTLIPLIKPTSRLLVRNSFFGHQLHGLVLRTIPSAYYSNLIGRSDRAVMETTYSKCLALRFYSKGKDKGKADKKKKSQVQLRDEDMEGIIDPQEVRDSFQKHVDRLKDDYVKHLSLRSSAGAVENLQVELEGSKYALQELAQIGRKSPQVLVINMSSFPQAIPSVMNALQHSGMNLNPQQEASMIYVPIPKVTKEHRESLAKNAKVLFNKCKDHIKDVQNSHIRHVKKQEQEISTDTSFAIQQQIHEWAESYTSQADKLMTAKQQELLGTS